MGLQFEMVVPAEQDGRDANALDDPSQVVAMHPELAGRFPNSFDPRGLLSLANLQGLDTVASWNRFRLGSFCAHVS